MTALYIIGIACEHAFGSLRTFYVYVWSAIVGAITSCLNATLAVGASGAIFGLLGLLATVLIRRRAAFIVRERRLGVVLAIWASYAIIDGSVRIGVDGWAHAGGLAVGICAGFFMEPKQLITGERPLNTALLVATLATLIYAMVYFVPALISLKSA